MDDRAVLLFMTTQAALQAEDALLKGGLEVEVVPKPAGLEGLCGIALEVEGADYPRAQALLDAIGIPFERYLPQSGAAGRGRTPEGGRPNGGGRDSGEGQ